MQRRRILPLLVVVGVVVVLAACSGSKPVLSSPLDQLITERKVVDGVVLDHEGELTVVDTKTGKPIPSCDELEKTDRKCKHRFGMDGVPPDVKIIRDTQVRVIDYVGSHCRTYVSKSNGKEYEVCRPPY